MKQFLTLTLLLILSTGAAQALEPQSFDQFGNPEEPAMRPYKWIFHGFKGLLYHPGKSFVDGNMNTPILGTVETTRGVRRGTVRLVESTWSGILFRPVPHKDEYKKLGRINENMEADEHDKVLVDALTNIPASILVGFPLFPVQLLVDHYPMDDDETVQIRQANARKIREARMQARKRDDTLTSMERAQLHYIGDRALAGKQETEGGGNLLKKFK